MLITPGLRAATLDSGMCRSLKIHKAIYPIKKLHESQRLYLSIRDVEVG